MTTRPQAACLACGGPAQRLLSPPALQFKGSGWYITDYARKSSPAEKSQSPAGDTGSGAVESGPGKKAPAAAEKEPK